MAEADRNQKQKRLRKRILPPGTSEYQVCLIYLFFHLKLFNISLCLVCRSGNSDSNGLMGFVYVLQAAWIVDNTDEEDSDSDDEADDGMVLDEQESDFPCQKGIKNFDLDDDQASLNLKDSDEETDVHSMMMVSFNTQ
jgi:pre-rRNA-processing protein TSR1